jgi:hypothetical protein
VRTLGNQYPQPGGGTNRDDAGALGGVSGNARLATLQTEGRYVATTQVEVWMPVNPAVMAANQANAQTYLYGPGEIPVAWSPGTAYRYGQAIVMAGNIPDVLTGLTYVSIYVCNQLGYVSGGDWPSERDYESPLDPTITDPTTHLQVPDPSYIGKSRNSKWIYAGYAGPAAAGAFGGPPGTNNNVAFSSIVPDSSFLDARNAGFPLSDIPTPKIVPYKTAAPYIMNAWGDISWYQYQPIPISLTQAKISVGYSKLVLGIYQVWGVPRLTNILYIP